MDVTRKKPISHFNLAKGELRPCLSAFDLTFLGIGAIVGAGIFVLTGIVAATEAGPAIIISYIIAGFACAFSALAYAELAAALGGCGSAYGYSYAGFGELVAWIVGWDLLLEYAVGVSAVSVGWSSYFNDILLSVNIHLPHALLQGPFSGGVLNCLAVLIIGVLSFVLISGMKASAHFNNSMVVIKLFVIFFFIVIASREVEPQNWFPFSPFGWDGMMRGAAYIFFAYIGFDAVSTAAEEAIHPQTDVPKGIIASLIICTILYIVVSGLLTGIENYTQLNVDSPISHSLLKLGYSFAAGVIGVGALAGLTTVMLVLFYGLSRIFFAMARDGLLPSVFAVTHKRTQTPVRIILLCGSIMATVGGFIPLSDLAELVNIGTLFAFIIVCAGVIILRHTEPHLIRPFKTPWMPVIPLLGILSCSYLICYLSWITLLRFIIWMGIGLLIYFSFGYRNSALNIKNKIKAT